MTQSIFVWLVSGCTIALVLGRPFGLPEWISATFGATLLCLLKLESAGQAAAAFRSGFDVYFFLIGMMLLSEIARENGVFSWLARQTTQKADGSRLQLFIFIYFIGVIVTTFMSNDATAVVLTPAVYACVKKAGVKPTAYLFACALIANAASFVLPISNPANLVIYAKNLPSLFVWLKSFLIPSVIAVSVTFMVLRIWFRNDLRGTFKNLSNERADESLDRLGKIVFCALGCVSGVLLVSSAFHVDLGLPTFASAVGVVALVSAIKREIPKKVLGGVSWGIVPLVGGLFIVVDTLNRAKVLGLTKSFFEWCDGLNLALGKEAAAFAVALASNIANNLPVGLTVGLATNAVHVSSKIRDSLLIGVDLGPNLSVTGSLATILWLMALRREGEKIGFFEFLKVGAVVMPISLFLSVLAL